MIYDSLGEMIPAETYNLLQQGEMVCPRGIPTVEFLMKRIQLLDITNINLGGKMKGYLNVALAAAVVTTSKTYLKEKFEKQYKQANFYKKDYDIFAYNNGKRLQEVLTTLMTDISTRQAILTYNDSFCTNSVFYYVRDNKLHSMVNSRSVDAINKFPIDAQYFCILQQMIANSLGCKYGTLTWNIGSFHFYREDIAKVKDILFYKNIETTSYETTLSTHKLSTKSIQSSRVSPTLRSVLAGDLYEA